MIADEVRTDPRLKNCMSSRRGAVLRELRGLLNATPTPRWATPAMITLGLASSFAETLGISLVVLFLYSAMGQLGELGETGGVLGGLFRAVVARLGGGTKLAFTIFLLIVARGWLALAYSLISSSVSNRISESVRNGIHQQYLDVAYDFIRRHDQAELLEILGTESWLVAGAHASFTRIVINFCSIIVFAMFLLALSWQIALTAFLGSLLISGGLRWLSAPARKLGTEVKRVHQALGERMLVSLQGMRTIRAFGQESLHHRAFVESSAIARRNSLQLDRLYAVLNPVTEIGYLAILCFIIGAAGWLQASFATTLAAVALLYRLQPHVRELEGNLLYLAQIEPQLHSVRAMLDRRDKEYLPAGERPISRFGCEVRFDNVSFAYRGAREVALRNASFTIRAGATTALVGPSGAGKTTIVSLLLRLYAPNSGCISVDEVNLQELRRSEWLGMIAVSGQDIDLIEGTLQDNILMARAGASEAEVANAARIAGLNELIEALPDGYENWIGQQGLNLSGGQRQRLGLARAVLRDPQLLILDEAMSALDRGLESDIRAALNKHFAGRTVLLITHRLETVLSADHVICIDQGRVQEEGSPEDLLSNPAGALSRLLRRRPFDSVESV
jgi:ABC-type multidrug transport system fused ATPase/permease subunit